MIDYDKPRFHAGRIGNGAPQGRRYVLLDTRKGWVNNATSWGFSEDVMKAGRYDDQRSLEFVKDSGVFADGLPHVVRIPVEDVELYRPKKA